MNSALDQQYYEVARPGTVAEFVMTGARQQIYGDFLRYAAPGQASTILDVGVSDVHTHGANWIEVQYPIKSNISACGLGEAAGFREAFPDVRYTQIQPNQRLPYADDQFEIATSNAVLEHVGSDANQAFFVSELVRVARKVFISVPHRFFPVEHHTGIPFLHYADWSFRLACRALGKSKWTDPKNLILMTRKQLRELSPEGSRVGYTGVRLGPFSSNLFMTYDKFTGRAN